MIDLLLIIVWFLFGGVSSFFIWKMENGKYFNLLHFFYCIVGAIIMPFALVYSFTLFYILNGEGKFNIPNLWEKKPIDIDNKIRNAKKNLLDKQ